MSPAVESGRSGHLHVCGSNRGLPGLTGAGTDWRALLGALRKTGYGGAVTVGSMALRPAPSPAKYRIWRAMMPDGPPEALLRCTSTGVRSLREAMRG